MPIPDDIAAIFDPLGNAVHTAQSFDLVGEDVLCNRRRADRDYGRACRAKGHLSGLLLTEHGHEGWEILNLPAINDAGRHFGRSSTIAALEKIKAAIGARDWQALCQQRPAPEDGDYFKADWFKPVSNLPIPRR